MRDEAKRLLLLLSRLQIFQHRIANKAVPLFSRFTWWAALREYFELGEMPMPKVLRPPVSRYTLHFDAGIQTEDRFVQYPYRAPTGFGWRCLSGGSLVCLVSPWKETVWYKLARPADLYFQGRTYWSGDGEICDQKTALSYGLPDHVTSEECYTAFKTHFRVKCESLLVDGLTVFAGV